MKVYNLAGVGGASKLKISVGGNAALLQGGLYERGDGPVFKRQAEGIESLLAALAARGYVMDDPKMIEAINDAVEACQNNAE